MEKVSEEIRKRESLQALVIVDDILASGDTARKALKRLFSRHGKSIAESSIKKVVFASVVSTEEGWENVERFTQKATMNIELYYGRTVYPIIPSVCEYMSEFGVECQKVKSSVYKYCSRLTKNKNIPTLGYNNMGLGVVFEHGCPNNSLPILWMDKDGVWDPIFVRH